MLDWYYNQNILQDFDVCFFNKDYPSVKIESHTYDVKIIYNKSSKNSRCILHILTNITQHDIRDYKERLKNNVGEIDPQTGFKLDAYEIYFKSKFLSYAFISPVYIILDNQNFDIGIDKEFGYDELKYIIDYMNKSPGVKEI